MERDRHRETLFQKAGDRLPNRIYEANPQEVSATPLGNQDGCMLSTIFGQRPIPESLLHYGNGTVHT